MTGKTFAVIGVGFGDEGKGLATDYFCAGIENATVIRHNGGAQAGHTVEFGGNRFVFHQLSSGSFRHADTFWAQTFMPDLYKLASELSDFKEVSDHTPDIYADPDACTTFIDDVLINMALEKSRGEKRHGSCGMGINEAALRNCAGFGLTIQFIKTSDASRLYNELLRIRKEYVSCRLESLGLKKNELGEYGELLDSKTVLFNFAEQMAQNACYVDVVNNSEDYFSRQDRVIFEGAQGLLLDSENKEYAPHVTASRTGLANPFSLCRKYGLKLDLIVYVMRSYVTRHGAGHLPHECEKATLGNISEDLTNRENEWQGKLRYGRYESPASLASRILTDVDGCDAEVALFITHLNETNGSIRFSSGDVAANQLSSCPSFLGKVKQAFLSYSPTQAFSDNH